MAQKGGVGEFQELIRLLRDLSEGVIGIGLRAALAQPRTRATDAIGATYPLVVGKTDVIGEVLSEYLALASSR